MIEHFADHAANERTFLAWVRTAIAVMAFGFLVEKFDLFLSIQGRIAHTQALSSGGQILGNVAGLLLILLGGAMVVVAAVRFRKASVDIDSRQTQPGSGTRMDLLLVSLVVLLGAALFVYLCYTVVRSL